MKCFDGKTAFVVGGTGGIGRSVCSVLAQECSKLIVHGRDEKKLIKVEKEMKDNVNIETCLVDFSEKSNISPLNFHLKQKCHDADILCMCYGPFLQKSLHEMSDFDWDFVAQNNYVLAGKIISECLRSMVEKKWGRLILIGGTRTDVIRGFRSNAAYAGAKTALEVVAKSVAMEYSKYNITCNVVLPGFVQTEYLSAELTKSLVDKSPVNALISPDKIAEAVLFLLKNNNINGTLLSIDDGWNP